MLDFLIAIGHNKSQTDSHTVLSSKFTIQMAENEYDTSNGFHEIM